MLLNTFVLVLNDKVISPPLVTLREYGTWFESVFDEYTSSMELYMKSVKKTGETVLEWHPGTRIGKWFDTTEIHSAGLKCWFIMQDSTIMKKLNKLKMAELRDAIPIAVNDKEGRRMLRVYTVDQIELYIRATIDKRFSINKYISYPKQIKIRDNDLDKLIKPELKSKLKSLF